MISNVKIYGLQESLQASGYPMLADAYYARYQTPTQIMDRVKKLGSAKVGSGHDCFLKGIIAQFDITLPAHVWQQAQRYHWFDIVSSQSKMHRITQMNLDKVCHEMVDARVKEVLQEKVDAFLRHEITYDEVMMNVPSGLMLTARISTNYLQLKTIYHQRRNHKLQMWKDICKQINEFEGFKELISEVK